MDYNSGLGPDRFLAGISFNFARQRYGCAESLIGSGMGGVVLGAISRSVLVDGLMWRWIAADPSIRRPLLLGNLLRERSGICDSADKSGVSIANLPRWLMPIPLVADLEGVATWWDNAQMPDADSLLEDFLNTAGDPLSASSDDPMHLLDAAGLRGAVLVLAFACHGNFLGLQSCLTEDGQPGHDLRDVYEALFMHTAAVGALTVLHGTAATVPELWPRDVPQEQFMQEAIARGREVAEAARPIHRLIAPRPRRYNAQIARTSESRDQLNPQALLAPKHATPFGGDLQPTIDAAERFWVRSLATPVTEEHFAGQVLLHEVLNYGGAYSNLEATLATYDKDGSGPISVFAARMLLEEAARLRWRFSATENEFADRATQYFDEFRYRRNKTIKLLSGNGVPRTHAERRFELPSRVLSPPPKPPTKNRRPIPTTAAMIYEFGVATQPREPGWLRVAYSLLSQVTHATPLGALHTIHFASRDSLETNVLTPELVALALDVTCMASAYLIGHSTLILTDIGHDGIEFRDQLRREASRVHAAARLVHGLG
ncbi:MAG: hypothetical protein P0Y48_07470 [Candidatus Microbacterium phytovorans]|uniref:Uncharacterized protein n=1 Tax=Candidatus Microbacterium phytovorans TaxID=3121374 RepID=A0AAJ5VXX3_9MICO|nr:hypothetical protein [Microbacterium sp.]WEK12324.1 MAG: hypothetical protein P0Y48_07470 [Microbacterium sp.]